MSLVADRIYNESSRPLRIQIIILGHIFYNKRLAARIFNLSFVWNDIHSLRTLLSIKIISCYHHIHLPPDIYHIALNKNL